MAMWNPWRGCHKHSDGCKNCYIRKGDAKRGVDTNNIAKTDNFNYPIERKKNGEYKVKSGSLVYVCFSSDFLLAEADKWRKECWQMIKQRNDCNFLFLTKRIQRFMECIPNDWGSGYDNVIVGCTIENQETANKRLAVFDILPIKYKNIIAQPLIQKINIEKYLNDVKLVVVGGEQDKDARPLHFEWVKGIHDQCKRHNVPFQFRQTGTCFFVNGKLTKISAKDVAF